MWVAVEEAIGKRRGRWGKETTSKSTTSAMTSSFEVKKNEMRSGSLANSQENSLDESNAAIKKQLYVPCIQV